MISLTFLQLLHSSKRIGLMGRLFVPLVAVLCLASIAFPLVAQETIDVLGSLAPARRGLVTA